MKSAVLAKNSKLQDSAPGNTTRRKLLKDAVGGSAALAIGLHAPAVIGQAKPFAGVTINGACFQHVFQTYLKEYLPEFEAATGMKVNLDLQAFPVYNQRMDLELSTKGSAYDFCNITFIYSGRWIGAGWMAPLDEYFKKVRSNFKLRQYSAPLPDPSTFSSPLPPLAMPGPSYV